MASALISATTAGPKTAANEGSSHAGKSPATKLGAPVKSPAVRRSDFPFVERRWRMPLARTERRQRAGAHIPHLTQGAKHARAGRFVTHDKRGGSALALRVEDKRGDRGTVFRAREPVRETPILQRIGGGPFAGFDFFHNFNRRGDASARGHWELAIMALQSGGRYSGTRRSPTPRTR